MKNKFATEGAVNISKKSAVKEHVKCKDYNKAEKLETAHIQIEFKCKNVKNNIKFSILKGFRNNFFIDLIF